jgi:hypothetical protein
LYYLGEDVAPLGGEPYYYPGEHEEQQGWSYYPSETYPQQMQGWEQQQQGSHRFRHRAAHSPPKATTGGG